jgi:DNA-binding MurR/RpiR family transcriptional regulator
MPKSSKSLAARITGVLAELSATERRLAEFLLDFPADLPAYTASELADIAHVSNATVTRFIHRLGYSSYGDARQLVRLEQKAGSPLLLRGSDQNQDSTLRAHAELGIQNLAATYEQLSGSTLDRVAQAMVSADRVWFAGFRNNYSFASYLRWQVFRVLETCILLPTPGETIGEYAVTFKKGDLLVVFALRRTTAAARHLVNHASKAGVDVVCITDEPENKAIPATWVIRCLTKSAGFLYNHVAVMSIAHFLASRVLELSGREGRRRMAKIEVAYETFEEVPSSLSGDDVG